MTMATYRIRPFVPEDAASVHAIVSEVLLSLDLRMDTEGVDADLLDIPKAYHGGCFLVVESFGVHGTRCIVGCGAVHDEGAGTFELRKMYFLPELRGRGMGRKLLSVLLDVARKKGARHLRLETNRRMKRAIELYRQFGFVEKVGTAPIPPRCDVVMELLLHGDMGDPD